MTDKKIFVVMAEPRLHDRHPFPINWFLTEDEAYQWIEKFGNKRRFYFEVDELVSTDGHC